MKTRKIAAAVLCALSVVTVFCFRLMSAPLTGTVTAAELGSALGALSLLPTVLAVALAFLLGDVVVSLLIGLSVGELMLLLMAGGKPAAQLLQIVPSIIDELVGVSADADNAKVLILCALVGGLVGVLMKTGGFEAAAKRITKKVKTPRSANLLGQLFCVLFFFDDYANALITGPVLRPIADKVGLSRERLAYIVDSTAAPVAGIAVVSSWVAVELAVITSGLETAGIADSAFQVFLRSIPYCFYCIFALVFMFITSITGREFGPMLKAERRARAAQSSACPESSAPEAADTGSKRESVSIWVAFGSIALLVLYLVASLLANRGDTITLLLRSAFLSSVAALAAAVVTKVLPAGDGLKAWLDGVTNIVPTIIVLLLAWSLAAIVEKLGTVYFVVELIASKAAWQLVPAIIFICCCAVSFAAGSYGCMFMVMPMAIPIACAVMENTPGIGSHFLPVCVACVLSGGIFGDHCSPMTDCTILAALGSGCEVMDHAVTQMPYAFTVALVSIFCIISATLGFSAVYTIALGILVLSAIILLFGKQP